MAPALYKGQLTTWKDDRGFGFITPDGGGKDIFLHISALPRAGRRPLDGDTILYEKVTEPDGKVRATRAFIQDIAPQSVSVRSQPKQTDWMSSLAGVVSLLATAAFIIPSAYKASQPRFDTNLSSSPTVQPETLTPSTALQSAIDPNCIIKGNISISSGNKLYHVPGMEDYDWTEIHPDKGERWFCTEAEAIAQGWRKAPR
ncbi:MAG: cold shock domain-containing protein [Nodosilinea sp.]